MSSHRGNRRKSPRVFFTLKQGKSARIVAAANPHQPIHSTILNIGSGGVALALDRKTAGDIRPGDRFRLDIDTSDDLLKGIDGSDMVVKYVQDYQIYVNLVCGGEFVSLPSRTRQRIDGWIQRRLLAGKT